MAEVEIEAALRSAASAGDAVLVDRLLAEADAELAAKNEPSSPWRRRKMLHDALRRVERDTGASGPQGVRGEPTALHRACKRGMDFLVDLLLQNTAVDAVDDKGRTPLHLSGGRGHRRCVRLLLDRGANVNAPDIDRQTPLHHACGRGRLRTVLLLLEQGADVSAVDVRGATPLHVVSSEQALVALLDQPGADDVNILDRDGRHPLLMACRRGLGPCARALLERGAAVDLLSSPLRRRGDDFLNRAALIVDLDTLRGEAALHAAVRGGFLELAELLLCNGASVDLRNQQGRTAVHLACVTGRDDVLALLLRHGATADVVGRKLSCKPLSIACKGGHVNCVQRLLDAGADPDHMTAALRTASKWGRLDCIELLLRYGTDMHGTYPALHAAARNDHVAAAEMLLDAGADITLEESGVSALQQACRDCSVGVVRLLLRRGARANREALLQVARQQHGMVFRAYIITALLLRAGVSRSSAWVASTRRRKALEGFLRGYDEHVAQRVGLRVLWLWAAPTSLPRDLVREVAAYI